MKEKTWFVEVGDEICIEHEFSLLRETEEKLRRNIKLCPICNKEMTFIDGAYFCDGNVNTEQNFIHKVIVLCKCGRRMLPNATYSIKEGRWSFWNCPHCYNRV